MKRIRYVRAGCGTCHADPPSSTEQMAREAAPRVTAPLLLEQMMKRIEGIADEVRALREEQRRHFDPGAGITQHAGADSRLHA